MKSSLNEKQYRLFLGATAISIGHGGQALITRLSGASVNTVRRGIQEVKAGEGYTDRVRKSGGGRKSSSSITSSNARIPSRLAFLDNLVIQSATAKRCSLSFGCAFGSFSKIIIPPYSSSALPSVQRTCCARPPAFRSPPFSTAFHCSVLPS